MAEQAVILVVDDAPYVITLLVELLQREYRVKVANSGESALRLVAEEQPDLILLDVMMPEMDGYEVLQQLRQQPDSREIPVLFLTAKGEIEDEQRGLALGAVDYIHKPIHPPIVLERIKTHLLLKQARDRLNNQNEELEERVESRTRQLLELQDATIFSMAAMAETRDPETGNHIRRTQRYLQAVAEALVARGLYREALTSEGIDLLFKSAPLHDIGKVGIPDIILNQERKLTPEEMEVMKRHTTYGYEILKGAQQSLSHDNPLLRHAAEIAHSHHERWGGNGYPQHLRGRDIPLGARLMAVADAYDALITDRSYRPGLTHQQALSVIREGIGSHFEPDIGDAFLSIGARIAEIAEHYPDVKSEAYYAL